MMRLSIVLLVNLWTLPVHASESEGLASDLYQNHILPSIDDGFDSVGIGILLGGSALTLIARQQDEYVRDEKL